METRGNRLAALGAFLAALASLLPGQPAFGQDQSNYPDHALRLIVPFEAGGGTDILARQVALALGKEIKQSIVVENRGGAGGILGSSAAAHAAPDGYTLLLGQIGPLAINPSLYPKLPYKPLSDFAPVSLVGAQPLVLALNPDVPAKSMKELIALAKAHPNQIRFSSAGNGSMGHLAGELFKLITGAPIEHIPYKGGAPAVNDVISGQVQLTFNVIPTILPLAKSNKLAILGVSYPSAAVPSAPLISADAPGYAASSWFGILVPAHTPAPIVSKLNTALRAAMQDPEVRSRFDAQGFDIRVGSPAEFTDFIRQETDRWSKVVKASGASVD